MSSIKLKVTIIKLPKYLVMTPVLELKTKSRIFRVFRVGQVLIYQGRNGLKTIVI